ncbi:MAG: pirin family protein [Proteobacteria bacterium]|nr:pirin family protein [Pseudomonadota bacterium]
MTARQIHKIYKSKPTIEGAGVHLKRAFGFSQVSLFDPFLMLDDFHTKNPTEYLPGFPWHPHRGIETITYIIEGVVEHGDSMGNKGVISAGDVQWMTAGSGIIHQEMPKTSPTGTMWGFQFWANLPASRKMMPPRYRDVKASDIPEVSLDSGVKVKIVSGEINDVKGPVQDIIIDPELLDVTVPASTAFVHKVKSGHTLLVYVLDGEGFFEEQLDKSSVDQTKGLHSPETVILYKHEGNKFKASAGKKQLRFLLLSGKPLGEPVAWEGPIVMNTQEELRIAFEEYREGTFIKKI